MFRLVVLGALVCALSITVETKTVLQANVQPALKADNFTAFGSLLNTYNVTKPITTIGIGFSECGDDFLGAVLSNHPGAISGGNPEKKFFTSKTFGNCNRFKARTGKTPYEQYIKGCFKGRPAARGTTTIDVSGKYGLYAWGGLVDDLKGLEDETQLRFIAVVCDPRERTLRASLKMQIEEAAANQTAPQNGANSMVANLAAVNQYTHKAIRAHAKSGYSEIIALGEYSRMLEEWSKHFPLSSLMVVNSNHLQNIATWRRIFFHTGLVPPSNKKIRRMIGPWKKPHSEHMSLVDQALQSKLNEHYDAADQDLWRFIGTQWW